jgi:hypothetical protein
MQSSRQGVLPPLLLYAAMMAVKLHVLYYVLEIYTRVSKYIYCIKTVSILGTFEKLRKATISYFMSVRPHGTRGSHWTDFHGI